MLLSSFIDESFSSIEGVSSVGSIGLLGVIAESTLPSMSDTGRPVSTSCFFRFFCDGRLLP